MFEMKYSHWLAIAKHIYGVEELSLLDQQRYDSYLRYGHEELLSMPDYRAAYKSILVAQENEQEELEKEVVEEPVPMADENLAIEAPSMEDNSVAQILALAVCEVSASEMNVLVYELLRRNGKGISASSKELRMDNRTYKKALESLYAKGYEVKI